MTAIARKFFNCGMFTGSDDCNLIRTENDVKSSSIGSTGTYVCSVKSSSAANRLVPVFSNTIGLYSVSVSSMTILSTVECLINVHVEPLVLGVTLKLASLACHT